MPTLIPLTYYSTQVGWARVDPELGALPSSLRWSVAIPASVLRQHSGRSDILLARLADPTDTILPRCHPTCQLNFAGLSYNLKLVRVALRPQLVHHLIELSAYRDVEANFFTIRRLSLACRRAIYIDSDHTNLTSANLREFPAPGDVAPVEPPISLGSDEQTYPRPLPNVG